MMNNDKKIQALKDQIKNLKKRPSSIYGTGHALSDEEKKDVLQREKDWKDKRIREILKQIKIFEGE